MSESQRAAAYGLMAASLSARGLEQSRNIMRLNHTIGEMTNRMPEYGEFNYYFTIMGTPSDTAPWGWQLDGHHLIINFFVLRDQVVMTPTFMGSEPVRAESGKFAGVEVLQSEDARGLAFMRSLDNTQRATATIQTSKTANNSLNLVLDYAGIRASQLNDRQRTLLLELVGEYVGQMRDGHARVKMEEVRRHINDTYFAWIGGVSDTSVFYYRVQSPVVLIEFDHQTPVALGRGGPPGRNHIHSVIRTPNGNDYGKDLLRQHHEQFRHDSAGRHSARR
jgi:hypothetical protein